MVKGLVLKWWPAESARHLGVRLLHAHLHMYGVRMLGIIGIRGCYCKVMRSCLLRWAMVQHARAPWAYYEKYLIEQYVSLVLVFYELMAPYGKHQPEYT